MKRNQGSVVPGVLGFLVLLGLVGYIFSGINESNAKHARLAGRNISQPIVGQMYMVAAADKAVNEVIAMPWKYGDDKEGITDRRFLLNVSSNVCAVGTWFVRSADGLDNIVSPPIMVAPKASARQDREPLGGQTGVLQEASKKSTQLGLSW